MALNETVRIGIIGCGALGQIHAQRFAELEGVAVVALADPVRQNLEKTAALLPVAPEVIEADYRETLDRGLDAACIATPDSLHVPQVLDALAANLHVLCEKPLTLDPLELAAVIESKNE